MFKCMHDTHNHTYNKTHENSFTHEQNEGHQSMFFPYAHDHNEGHQSMMPSTGSKYDAMHRFHKRLHTSQRNVQTCITHKCNMKTHIYEQKIIARFPCMSIPDFPLVYQPVQVALGGYFPLLNSFFSRGRNNRNQTGRNHFCRTVPRFNVNLLFQKK